MAADAGKVLPVFNQLARREVFLNHSRIPEVGVDIYHEITWQVTILGLVGFVIEHQI
jgi:hypothetical protein